MKNLFVLLPIFALLLTGCQSFDRIESTSFSQQHQQPRIQPSPTPCPQDGMLCPDQTTIIYRHADTCQVDKSDCPYPTPSKNTSWKASDSPMMNLSFNLPSDWTMQEKMTDDGYPYLILTSNKEPKLLGHPKSPEIVLWENTYGSPYSTSGALCANTGCVELNPIDISTSGQWFEVPLMYAHNPTESSLDYFRFQVSPTSTRYKIYVTLSDMNQLPEIKQILLSLQPRAL